MQLMVLSSQVRIRVAQGSAVFYNPWRQEIIDNGMHASDGKGTWITLDAGTQFAIVAAYPKADTFMCLIDETGQGMKSENTYGAVFRGLSMEKILENAILAEAEVAAEVVAA